MWSKDQTGKCLPKRTARVIILGCFIIVWGHSCLNFMCWVAVVQKDPLELCGSSLNTWSAGTQLLEGGHEESCGICQMHWTRWICRGQSAEQMSLTLSKVKHSGLQQSNTDSKGSLKWWEISIRLMVNAANLVPFYFVKEFLFLPKSYGKLLERILRFFPVGFLLDCTGPFWGKEQQTLQSKQMCIAEGHLCWEWSRASKACER